MEQPEPSSGPQSFEFTVTESYNGVRLDHYLVQMLSGLSRSQIINAVKSGDFSVNGRSVKAGCLLRPGDIVAGSAISSLPEAPPPAQAVEFTVLLEEPAFLIIDKPPGLVVHPGSGNPDFTLVNGLLHRYGDLAGVGDTQRPGIVHRLDKDTSGVMVIGRSKQSHRKLSEDFKQRRVKKTYLALVHGRLAGPSGAVI
jgi:23S rRNA pseudouridine1911/1915/1917 synthase